MNTQIDMDVIRRWKVRDSTNTCELVKGWDDVFSFPALRLTWRHEPSERDMRCWKDTISQQLPEYLKGAWELGFGVDAPLSAKKRAAASNHNFRVIKRWAATTSARVVWAECEGSQFLYVEWLEKPTLDHYRRFARQAVADFDQLVVELLKAGFKPGIAPPAQNA